MTRVGVVGLGYRGPNLARNFDRLPDAELAWICDASDPARARWASAFPRAQAAADLDELLGDDSLDAVAVATQVPSHAELAQRVLAAGKHCFVEKPLAQSVEDAERVVEAARDGARVLMVGHLLEYHPGIERLKELIDSGELGSVRYLYSNRLNLGVLREDENALWSLGAHDVSVILRLAGEEPYACRAMGESYMREGIEDVVFCYLRFPSGLAAHMHLSWLDPQGAAAHGRWLAPDGDLRRHGAGAQAHRLRQGLRRGLRELWRVHRPLGRHLQPEGRQRRAAAARVRALRQLRARRRPTALGEAGLRAVRVLEALQQSLRESTRAATV